MKKITTNFFFFEEKLISTRQKLLGNISDLKKSFILRDKYITFKKIYCLIGWFLLLLLWLLLFVISSSI